MKVAPQPGPSLVAVSFPARFHRRDGSAVQAELVAGLSRREAVRDDAREILLRNALARVLQLA